MRFLSVCSGIEAASVAWHPLGWECAAVAEVEPFPSAVLAHHFPSVPNLGDITARDFTERAHALGPVQLLVGGTPCQSFSVAGLRKGLADPRGGLTLRFLEIARDLRPRWVVWENVPGVLSADGGRAFGAFLGGLAELGYGWAYRVLDAQYLGVPQRRRRVFVVGCLGDWTAAAAVLLERHSLSGDPPPSREKGAGTSASVAPSPTGSGRGVERTGESRGQDPVVAVGGGVAHSLRGEGFDASEDGAGRGTPLVPEAALIGGGVPEVAWCLQERDAKGPDSDTKPGHLIPEGGGFDRTLAKAGTGGGNLPLVGEPIAFSQNQREEVRDLGNLSAAVKSPGTHEATFLAESVPFAKSRRAASADDDETWKPGEVANTLNAFDQGDIRTTHAVVEPVTPAPMRVRRLTPRECERLQGFPDDYSRIPWKGKAPELCPDGPRYRALGNSMAVPVMRWIGERIQMVEEVLNQRRTA